MDATLVFGQQARPTIPAEIRATSGLEPGDRPHLHVTGRRLVFQRQADAVAEVRELGRAVPAGRSLVDELLAERRCTVASE